MYLREILTLYFYQARPHASHIILPVFIMGILYWISALPVTDQPSPNGLPYWVLPSVNNALHIPAYAVLTLAWHWSLGAWTQTSSRAIGACTIATAYGLFTEWYQSFVPGRYTSSTDVLLNAAGVVLGLWLAIVLSEKRRKWSEKGNEDT